MDVQGCGKSLECVGHGHSTQKDAYDEAEVVCSQVVQNDSAQGMEYVGERGGVAQGAHVCAEEDDAEVDQTEPACSMGSVAE
jgi:hypothetical protein